MTAPSCIDGVLLRADAVSGTGEDTQTGEFVVVVEDTGEDLMIELRLGDRKDTIWWMPLSKLKEAIRQLERAEKARQEAKRS
jgi:hypothetical protein